MHTPGPWNISGTDTRTGAPAMVSGKGDAAICDLYRRNPDNEANARLIAAAPELLAALERLMASQLGAIPPNVVHEVVTAIAKATGGAPC
jgi:hypothetical protein